MKRNKINYTSWGENISYRYETAFHSHEGLMNSLGHRNMILNTKLTKVFAGTSFEENDMAYLTLKYYK